MEAGRRLEGVVVYKRIAVKAKMNPPKTPLHLMPLKSVRGVITGTEREAESWKTLQGHLCCYYTRTRYKVQNMMIQERAQNPGISERRLILQARVGGVE